MEGEDHTAEHIAQQNKLYYAKQKLKYKHLFANLEYNNDEHKNLMGSYTGYLSLQKKHAGQNEQKEYFSSSFLKNLKEKRNNMFSDQIIGKMTKVYDLKEYQSDVDWRSIASNGVNLNNTKFSANWQVEIENYRSITERMMNR